MQRVLPVIALATIILSVSPAMATVSAGVQKWNNRDWDGAVAEWTTPAARGDADALFNMGQAYKLGRGVSQNLDVAQDYYRKAGAKGHVGAIANLGISLYQDGRKTEALAYLRDAADKGDGRASYVIGVATFNGDGAPRNQTLGYAYMLRARESGLPQADAQAARMATILSAAERSRGEAAAAALAAGEPVPVELIDPTNRPPAPVQTVAAETSDSGEEETAAAVPAAAVSAAATPVAGNKAPVPAPAVKVATPKAEPSAKAGKAAAPADGWRVQLGAFANEAAARTAWATLVSQSASLLEGSKPVYSPKGRLVRLQLGPYPSRESARDLCAKLSAAGRPCFVTEG